MEKGIGSSATAHVLEGLCPMRQILVVVEEVCFGEVRVAFLQQSGGEHLTHGPGERSPCSRRRNTPALPRFAFVTLSCHSPKVKTKESSEQP